MLPLIFAAMALFFAAHGYLIKHRGWVGMIAGVKDPSPLKNPGGLGNWVGGMAFANAGIMAVAALLTWLIPPLYNWIVMMAAIVALLAMAVATARGCQARSETR